MGNNFRAYSSQVLSYRHGASLELLHLASESFQHMKVRNHRHAVYRLEVVLEIVEVIIYWVWPQSY